MVVWRSAYAARDGPHRKFAKQIAGYHMNAITKIETANPFLSGNYAPVT